VKFLIDQLKKMFDSDDEVSDLSLNLLRISAENAKFVSEMYNQNDFYFRSFETFEKDFETNSLIFVDQKFWNENENKFQSLIQHLNSENENFIFFIEPTKSREFAFYIRPLKVSKCFERIMDGWKDKKRIQEICKLRKENEKFEFSFSLDLKSPLFPQEFKFLFELFGIEIYDNTNCSLSLLEDFCYNEKLKDVELMSKINFLIKKLVTTLASEPTIEQPKTPWKHSFDHSSIWKQTSGGFILWNHGKSIRKKCHPRSLFVVISFTKFI
jgi:hypothetical protein